MNSFNQETSWDKIKNGTHLPRTDFINTKADKLKGLKFTGLNYTEFNRKPETIKEVIKLKAQLIEFWSSNKHILD